VKRLFKLNHNSQPLADWCDSGLFNEAVIEKNVEENGRDLFIYSWFISRRRQ
jgi:hypothetical protein